MEENKSNNKKSSLFSLLKPYSGTIGALIIFAIISSGLSLTLPKIISINIDAYTGHVFILKNLIVEFGTLAVLIFIFTYLQSIAQVYVSERVARDLREKLAYKISKQSYVFVEKTTQAKIITNFTADVDSIKAFISQALVSLISSLVIVIGAVILLLSIDWILALAVLTIIPIIFGIFYFTFSRVKVLFLKTREVIDWLNKVINESILGSALIRVLNSEQSEYEKFMAANTDAKNIGLQILRMFAGMIPAITFIANIAALIILVLGGHFVINNAMTLGDFAAFNSYVALLIFPILIIGVMSNFIAQATASYNHIAEVLESEEKESFGELKNNIKGDIEIKNLVVSYGEKSVLKNISFKAAAGTKTAIIGPTAAGKTQLLYSLIGLIDPSNGVIEYDGRPVNQYDLEALHSQIGFVFQDSIVFNLTLRENIAFSGLNSGVDLEKALETAELKELVESLPLGLDTIVSERGENFSGGQKQRIMLARALALNPKILLLDDFTARVDNQTERKILDNIIKNYPDITLISVTQKILSVEKYDQIIVLMEGELVASGKHDQLLATSPEYVQIFNSQKSTIQYE